MQNTFFNIVSISLAINRNLSLFFIFCSDLKTSVERALCWAHFYSLGYNVFSTNNIEFSSFTFEFIKPFCIGEIWIIKQRVFSQCANTQHYFCDQIMSDLYLILSQLSHCNITTTTFSNHQLNFHVLDKKVIQKMTLHLHHLFRLHQHRHHCLFRLLQHLHQPHHRVGSHCKKQNKMLTHSTPTKLFNKS